MFLLPINKGVEVHAHLRIERIHVKANDLALLHCRAKSGDYYHFMLMDRADIMELRRRFKVGDCVNVMSRDGLIKKINKGIDVEV